jgi:hypothetical protein
MLGAKFNEICTFYHGGSFSLMFLLTMSLNWQILEVGRQRTHIYYIANEL